MLGCGNSIRIMKDDGFVLRRCILKHLRGFMAPTIYFQMFPHICMDRYTCVCTCLHMYKVYGGEDREEEEEVMIKY